jgi:hypothetical protein
MASASANNISATGSARVHVGHHYDSSRYEQINGQNVARASSGGTINFTFGSQTSAENPCVEALRPTDPRHDKARIEEDKGSLLGDVYKWVLTNDAFLRWRQDEQSRLLWIRGDPGKGKTMLLCGIVDELEKDRGGLSYFFCQATDDRINSATAVLRGLIYMLVVRQPSLIQHVQKRYDHAGRQLFEGINAWIAIRDIFTDILRDPALHPPCLVVDALDECQTGRPQLLGLIVSTLTAFRVKWLVSSRNWFDIEEKLAQVGQPLSLELNTESVSAAVQLYIQAKVRYLAETKKYDDQTAAQVTGYLSSNASDTFLWVALVCQSLEKVHRFNALKTLRNFPPGLDTLYGRMMKQIRSIDDPDDVHLCLQILSVASVVYRPVSLDELGSLIDCPSEHDPLANSQIDNSWLTHYVGLCGSFLAIRERTVSFVHQSAKDFTCNPSLNPEFPRIFPHGIGGMHHALFSKSLQLLSRTLRRDIYQLSNPGTAAKDIMPPSPNPLASVIYSCLYWVDHLLDAPPPWAYDIQDGGPVHRFLCKVYLYWLEVLSLAQSLSRGILAVENLHRLLQVRLTSYFI